MTTATINRPGISAGAVRPLRDRPVAAYGRISKITKGDGAYASMGIDRQHKIARQYCEIHFPGAEVHFFADNLSAFKPGVFRPEFERMMEAVRAGEYRAVVAVHVDRLVRSVMAQEVLWADCKKRRTELHVVALGKIDSPMVLQIMAAIAEAESRIKQERLLNKHKELAEDGKSPGGRKRFGYNADWTVNPVEAEAVKEMARRVLAGESLSAIARDMDRRGIRTARGGQWRPSTVGELFRKGAHLAGIRTHSHEDMETGERVHTEHPAQWEAILERGQWEAVCHLLSRPERRTNHRGGVTYLLSGLGVCGADGCGLPLRGVLRRSTGKAPAYACSSGRHCLRPVELVDEVVKAEMVTRLSLVDAAGALVDDSAAVSVSELEAAVKLTEEAFSVDAARHAAGEMSDRVWGATAAAFDARMTDLEDALADARVALKAPERVLEGMVHPGDLDAAKAAWEDATDDRRREVIRFLSTVRVYGAGRNRHAGFDPAQAVRVEFTPRG